uniref:Uncharacterized protein n=1 Tax=Panagrolaimus sp. PS1159 TaxID=55785 RepID=A0AC35GXD0_9BILA
KLLDKGLGYFLLNDRDKLLAIKRRIEKMHKSDETISNVKSTDVGLEQVKKDMRNPQNENPKKLDDYYNLPLMNQNQIDAAKEYFSKLDFGVHYWNKFVLDKRRYELIEIPEPPTDCEPTEIKEIREEVYQFQRSKPWLFQKNQLISVVKEWIDESTTLKESPVSRRIEMKDISVSHKRTIDEVIAAEEDAFLLATPIKQGRKNIFADTPAAKVFKAFVNDTPSPSENDSIMSPVVNKDIDNKLMTDKQWERIKQITKTPPATPLVSRLQKTPEPSTIKQPTSILKSNKVQSRITASTKRVKLQFDDNLSTIKSIPNRHEQRIPLPDAFTMEDNVIEEDVLGPVKLNFDNIDDDEHPEAKPRKLSCCNTPSRESAMEPQVLGRRRSPRLKLRKSSVNLEPVKSMEPLSSIAEEWLQKNRRPPLKKKH